MTISSVVPVNNYTGNGSTTTFDFDFLIENSEELVVTKSDSSGNVVTLRENVDYSIHEIGNTSGSYITFPISGSTYSVLSSDEVLTLSLELEIKQENRFPQARNFEPPIVEKALDYIIRLIQILNRKQERSIKVKESPNLNTEELVNNIEQIKANLTTLESINNDLTNINAVNSNKTNIDAVAGKISDVETVAGISEEISSVADNSANINAVNSNKTNIDTVAGLDSDISAVIGISSDITAVADNTTDISTVANNISDINNAYSNAQTALTKAEEASLSASSAQASETLAKDWANKMSGIVADNEYSAKYYALQSRDNAGITYKELNANLGYSRKDTLDDTRLFNDVKKLAQNSFDSTKFTAEGTPSVSSDGIASGFSSGNYLKSSVTVDCTKTFRIVFNEKRGSGAKFNGFQLSKSGVDSTPLFFVQSANATTITLGLYINETLSTNEYDFSHSSYTDINYIVSWDKTSYTLEIENAQTNETILTQTVSGSTALSNGSSSTGVIIYGYNWNCAAAISSTDLKQTIVHNGGIPVFLGNKTGEEKIIENNYTVVGSLTIADGIASGFSTNDYITSGDYKQNLGNADNWEIEVHSITASSTSATYFGALIHNKSDNDQAIHIDMNNSHVLRVYLKAADGTNIFYGSNTPDSFDLGSPLAVKIAFTGTQYLISTKISGGDWKVQLTANNSKKIMSLNVPLIFGSSNSAGNSNWTGSIDVKSIKVKENGGMTYCTELSVPYIENKHGVLVVDGAYADRVQLLYGKYDSALYYTLDRINKESALPYGDIYSLLIKRTDGDWQMIKSANISLSTSTSVGTYDIDLSTILPDNEHNYECIFRYYLSRTDVNNSTAFYNIFTNTSETKRWLRETVQGAESSSDTVSSGGQFTAIIGTERIIRINISGKDLTEQTLELVAYKRLGANY